MRRRDFLATSAATLAVPALASRRARAAGSTTLKFIPQADLAVLDPIWTTAYVTRNHGFMVFDTLYGQDAQYNVSPQMAEGATTSSDGKTWTIKLRDHLAFVDGTPVLARDCVASLKRWGARDSFGQALFAATDELSAPDDKTLVFRLKRPFPLLTQALGKTGSNIPVIMPERLAKTSPYTQVTEMVGSGPYRFVANERVPGSLVVYEKNPHYVPRSSGTASFTAGPKVAHFDRVEWHVISDMATATSAMTSGEIDWWENPSADVLPLLHASRGMQVVVQDKTGSIGVLRPNFLFPPFDNLAFRRALLPAVNQAEFMTAAAGTDKSLWHVPVGAWCPSSPMASNVGMGVLDGPHDMAKVREAVKASGYAGEKVVLMDASDFPIINAICQVSGDMLTKAGVNVDMQAMDWGTVVQRRTSHNAPDKGGWNLFCTYWSGLDEFNPAVNPALRGNGDQGWFGWPKMPEIEQQRNAWLAAPDAASQKTIAAQMQQTMFDLVPYYQLGQLYQPTAFRGLTDMLSGFVLFWNVRRT